MKKKWLKILCPVLALVLVAGIGAGFALSATGTKYPFRVGYSIQSIQPDAATFTDTQGRGLPLGGYGNTAKRRADYTKSEEYEYDKLYCTCIAMADENDNKVLLLAMDLIRTTDQVAAAVRSRMAKEYNIPAENIMINASHTHSAPDYDNGENISVKYTNFVIEQLCVAAREALADLTEVETMRYGSIEVEQLATDSTKKRMNFTRHYVMELTNKKTVEKRTAAVGDNFDYPDFYYTTGGSSTWSVKYTGHTLDADPTMYMVEFTRKDDKAPVLMTNFRAHPHSQGSVDDTRITGDTVSAFRYFMRQEGYLVAHFQGAAGMTNSNSYIASDMILSAYNTAAKRRARTTDDANWVSGQTEPFLVQYGKIMVNFAKSCISNMAEGDPHTLTTSAYTYSGATNKRDVAKYADALIVQDMWNNSDKYLDMFPELAGANLSTISATVRNYAIKTYGIRSVYQANAIVSQKNRLDFETAKLYTVALDDIWCIATCPNEMFHQNSIDYETSAVASGKFKMAMTFGYTNGADGYLPSLRVWDYSSYETDVTHFASGTGERIAEAFCNMLGVEYLQTPKDEWK